MMIYTKTQIHEIFIEAYTANFGKLTGNDGLAVYLKWVETVEIDDLVSAINDLGRYWDKVSKPRLGNLKRVYSEYRKLSLNREIQSAPGPPQDEACPECHGKCFGYCIIVCEKGKWKYFSPKAHRNTSCEKKIVEHPCPGAGKNHYKESDRILGECNSFDDFRIRAEKLIAGWKSWSPDKEQLIKELI